MGDFPQPARRALAELIDRDSSVVVVVVDSAGTIETCNEGLKSLLGLEEPPLGRSLAECLSDESRRTLEELDLSVPPDALSISFLGPLAPVIMHCEIAPFSGGLVILGTRRTLSDDESFRSLSSLNNELMNLNRLLQRQNLELERAQATIKTLSGLIPICSLCKKVRNDDGYWQAVESYVAKHSEARFSHSVCEECVREHYADLVE